MDEAGHDVVWVGNFTKDPGDDAILKIAYQEKRVLITLDKDFGELVIVHDKPHYGIIRLVGHSAIQQGPISKKVLKKYVEELQEGAIITVEKTRVRVRASES